MEYYRFVCCQHHRQHITNKWGWLRHFKFDKRHTKKRLHYNMDILPIANRDFYNWPCIVLYLLLFPKQSLDQNETMGPTQNARIPANG